MRTIHAIKKTEWDILLASDIHIRSTIPISRKDPDFIETMWSKLSFMFQVGHELDVPVVIAGDLGNTSIWGDKFLNTFWNIWNYSPVELYIIPGQHDLLHHNLKSIDETAFGILSKMKKSIHNSKKYKIHIIKKKCLKIIRTKHQTINIHFVPYGENKSFRIRDKHLFNDESNMLVFHDMVVNNKLDYKEQKTSFADKILNKYKNMTLIVTGDNHVPFVHGNKGRHLINCGSMMRTKIIQTNHRPRFYLYSFNCKEYRAIYWPIKKDVFKAHNKKEEEEPAGLDSFFNKLKKTEGVDFSFRANMKAYVDRHTTRKQVRDKLRKAGAL